MNDLEDKRTKPWAMVLFIGVSFLFPLVTSFWTLTNEIDSQAWIPEFSWRHQPALDIWFDSDPPLVYDSMTNTNARWQKTNRHPLFPYLGVIPVKAFGLLGGLFLLACLPITSASAFGGGGKAHTAWLATHG